jgi:hypothetical protein
MKKVFLSGTLGVLSEIIYTLLVLGVSILLTAFLWLSGL